MKAPHLFPLMLFQTGLIFFSRTQKKIYFLKNVSIQTVSVTTDFHCMKKKSIFFYVESHTGLEQHKGE